MQRIVSKYGTAAHLAILAVAPLFLSPTVTFWLAGLSLAWLLMEPSRLGNESLAGAQRRSFAGLLGDALTWTLLAVTLFAALRLANGGVGLAYDAERGVWSLAGPALALFPGRAEGAGLRELAEVVALTVVLIGCRHALGKSARYAFLVLATVLAGAVATTWAIGLRLGWAGCLAKASCALVNPTFSGSVFGVYLVASVAVVPAALERRWYALLLLSPIAVGGTALGLFLFAPPVVAALYAALALLALLYGVIYLYIVKGPAGGLKVLLVVLLGWTGATLLSLVVTPSDVMNSRLETFRSVSFAPDGFWETRSVLDKASESVWREKPWLGAGLGSWQSASTFHFADEDWESVPDGQVKPYGSYWLLLSERGLVGAFAIVCPLLLLLWTYFSRLVRGLRLEVPATSAVFGLLVLAAVAAESFVDAALFAPGMMLSVALFLSVAAGTFPKEKPHG